MSSFSSRAASTLTRPRIAVVAVAAATTIAVGYYFLYPHQTTPIELLPGSRLHRSNAVRRRPRRRSRDYDDNSESDSHGDENIDTNALVPLGEGIAVADEPTTDDFFNDPSQAPRQRTGENIVTLLFRVSEDNARRNAYVHRGCQCNGCGAVPIRGIRYRCANCADFDLCEACESQGLHNKTHVFYKVRIPAPPFVPRQIQPVWYPGDPDNTLRNLPRPLLAKWSQETGFERVELDAFWEQWTFMANTEWRDDPHGLCLAMDRKTFERCLVPSGGYRHAQPNLIHDRMFAFYDTNGDDLIGFEEFLVGVSYRKRKDKLKRIFQGYDIDKDGYVNRRDFLRMFRAYYVLYKQMHRDILEGMDDHMMTTTEVQQLINGRQPLSSFFGREGRVPPADHPRPLEGKVFRPNGDVDIHDGKDGVLNKDKPDTSSREEILSSLFARNANPSIFTESFGASRRVHSPSGDSRYLSGIINTPQNMVDLGSLLSGDYSQIEHILDSLQENNATVETPGETADSESSNDDDDDAGDDVQVDGDSQQNRNGQTTDLTGDASESRTLRIAPDSSRFTNRVPTESQLRSSHQAHTANGHRLGQDKRKRILARKQLYERWKRRQFYLDEEEGAMPPQGWDDSNDVLESLGNAGESSKAAQSILLPRSRSSSKVRFAEEADDYETRSNPSTSSRSIPERWGGIEIPDAERDAGKEILYQVTQQAFNELLDEIFKPGEDLAVRAAETKEQRQKYRPHFENINVVEEDENDASRPTSRSPPQIRSRNRPIREQSLDELLAETGYTVTPEPREEYEPVASAESSEQSEEEATAKDEHSMHGALAQGPLGFLRPTETRDLTWPQFRPNSSTSYPQQASSILSQENNMDGVVPTHAPEPTVLTTVEAPSTPRNGGSNEAHTSAAPEEIPHWTLVEWKRLDLAEEEAKIRGGWGRLSYEEFETIYREHEFQDSSRNRLDYLGSWIDFCIP